MRKFCKILSAPFLLVLAVSALSQGSQAQAVQDRIAEPIDSASMSPLVGTMQPLAKAEFDTGPADNSKVLQGMSIGFKRTDAQQAALKALLQAQQDPASPSYHKWLTPAQFGQQFGMSAADLAKVSAWLQQEGFTVAFTSQSNNRSALAAASHRSRKPSKRRFTTTPWMAKNTLPTPHRSPSRAPSRVW